MTRAVLIVVVLARWAVPLGAQTAPPAKPAQASGNAQDLSSQATDPTAALMSLNFLNDVKVSHWDNDEGGFEFEFKPVVPFAAWGKANILRVVVPFQTAGPGEEGLKDVSIFDLVILPQKWGRLGLGPVMRWAESSGGAASKFLIGPRSSRSIRCRKDSTWGCSTRTCSRAKRPSRNYSRSSHTRLVAAGR